MDTFQIQPITVDDCDWISEFLHEHWDYSEIVTRGQVHYSDELNGFIASHAGNRIGLATYYLEGGECELVTINSLSEGMGIGTELLKAVIQTAVKENCSRIWTIVTNDNVNALRFFQTRGFVCAALHRNAVEKSRELNPDIPSLGFHNIPIRDEIELEMNF